MAHPSELPPPPEPPEQLGEAGRRYWQRITGRYALSEAEEETLGHLCRVLDRIASLDAIVDDEGVIDSAGHTHPALIESRRQRGTYKSLLLALKLPGEGPQPAGRRYGSANYANRPLRPL